MTNSSFVKITRANGFCGSIAKGVDGILRKSTMVELVESRVIDLP